MDYGSIAKRMYQADFLSSLLTSDRAWWLNTKDKRKNQTADLALFRLLVELSHCLSEDADRARQGTEGSY